MYKQIIIVRKDLSLSPGKLSTQVSHASMVFLTSQMREHCESTEDGNVKCSVTVTQECFDEWINDIFTKVVLGAKNKNQLLKAKTMAEELGMVEGKDFFLIKDCCLTELEPEEFNENGVGRTLTCIGFAPMPAEIIDQISKKYQLYK